MTKKDIYEEVIIEKFDKEKEKKDNLLLGLLIVIVFNGFIYYYYYMRWVKKLTPDQVVSELITHKQDFINIMFFTFVNYALLYILLF